MVKRTKSKPTEYKLEIKPEGSVRGIADSAFAKPRELACLSQFAGIFAVRAGEFCLLSTAEFQKRAGEDLASFLSGQSVACCC